MSQKRDQVTDAVLAFLNAQSSDEKKRIVEKRRDVLLTDAADEILVDLLTQYRGDVNDTGILDQRRGLLARCRREGIDAAFADPLQSLVATRQGESEFLLQELSSLSAPGEMTRRISLCREALSRVNRGEQPEVWAWLHALWGDSLQQDPQGDRAENVEEAISRYELALEVYTREDFPLEWAMTQKSLGNAYEYRIGGKKTKNVEEAISRYELALEVYTRDGSPAEWAMIQYNLAGAYSRRIREDEVRNLKEAISRYELALEVYAKENFPVQWAGTHNNLANTYNDLAYEYTRRHEGGRAPHNLELAISHYEQALEVRTRQDFPLDWAAIQYNLGNAYYLAKSFPDQIGGDYTRNLKEAISRYELALEVYTREDFPLEWAMTRDNLVDAYSHRRSDAVYAFARARTWDERKRILEERRDVLLSDAAGHGIPEEHRALLGRCRREGIDAAFANQLMTAPDEMPRRVAACRQTLALIDRDDEPEWWASLHVEVGDSLRKNLRGARAENLEEAISHYELAVEVYTREDFSEDWARTQCHLAGAYRDRIQGDRAQNLEEAISRYELAVEVYTREEFPLEWAITQSNLANAYDPFVSYSDLSEEDYTRNLEEAVSRYELALEVYTRENFPAEWAMIQYNLANAYRGLDHTREEIPLEWAMPDSLVAWIEGDKAENTEEAISRYELALEVYTREEFPLEWAITQSNLANAYGTRIRGKRPRSWNEIRDAVYAFVNAKSWRESKLIMVGDHRDVLLTDAAEEFLANLVRRYKDGEYDTAILEEYLALLGRCRRKGIDAAFADRLQDPAYMPDSYLKSWMLEAIGFLEELKERVEISKWFLVFVFDVLITSSKVERAANAYFKAQTWEERKRIVEAHQEVLLTDAAEEAIMVDSVSTKVYRKIYRKNDSSDLPQKVLARCRRVGIDAAFADRLPSVPGEMPRRVAACRQTLALIDRDDEPEWWASLHVEVGDSLRKNLRGARAENLEEAISHYELAVEVYTREDFSEDWARTQCHLAGAYRDRIQGDRAQNLEEAISHYEGALEVYTRENFPVLWAQTQNSLAVAYSDPIWGDRAENVEEVISRYEPSLEVYTREGSPADWAATQNNLADAFLVRIRGDRAENVEEAISRCEQSLEVRTRQALPVGWAQTQNSLATAYRNRIRGDRAENIEKAISRCEQALEVRTRQTLPVGWAQTQNNLAAAYRVRIKGARAENLEEAISHYEGALEVYTREDYPADWAATQNNLAAAYRVRIRGDGAENVEEAISHCQLALEIYTRENYPATWAGTQHLLATAYSDRIRGDGAENVEEAISRFELALEVYAPGTLPQDCRDSALGLGRLLYNEGRYAEARSALATAHDAVEALRGELGREGSKQRLAEENADLYAQLVHSCLMEDDEEAAFDYAVAGKGRAFVDMLATARFDLSAAGADDPRLAQDLRRTRELRQQIDNLLSRPTVEGGIFPDGDERANTRSQRQANLRTLLQEQEADQWEEMSYRYPNLMATQQAPTLLAEEAQGLSEELRATLVEYYRHAGGWCAFVVTSDSLKHVPLPGLEDPLPGAEDENILELMIRWLERIESPAGRNKLSYGPLRQLHRALIAPLQNYLPSGGRVVLAPFARLHLLPLGAALDPDTGLYVAEDHTITFAPNLAALRTAQQRDASSDGGRAGKVEGLLSVAYPDVPESDSYLPNVLPEAEAVARHFARVTPLHGEAASPEAVLSHARGQDVVHLGCHGHFDATSPQQSGLMLSGGWLTVGRIITELRLQQTRLATIGACLSGRIQVRQGEEHVGLVQAMISAGAGAVVAGLWRVDDAATRALLEVFYAEAASGDSLAGALADAGALLRSYPNWKHPYYWAAFQVSGLAHGPYEPGLSHLSEDVVGRIETANQESMQRRGGPIMNETAIVRDSQVLLEQMGEEPEAVLDALGPAEGRKVLARLRKLSGEADRVRTEAELLELADDVHRLVEETPALADLLLEQGADSANTRTFPALDPNDPAHDETRQAAEQGILMRNHMANAAERLERALSEKDEESR